MKESFEKIPEAQTSLQKRRLLRLQALHHSKKDLHSQEGLEQINEDILEEELAKEISIKDANAIQEGQLHGQSEAASRLLISIEAESRVEKSSQRTRKTPFNAENNSVQDMFSSNQKLTIERLTDAFEQKAHLERLNSKKNVLASEENNEQNGEIAAQSLLDKEDESGKYAKEVLRRYLKGGIPDPVQADIDYENDPDNARFTNSKGNKSGPSTGTGMGDVLKRFEEGTLNEEVKVTQEKIAPKKKLSQILKLRSESQKKIKAFKDSEGTQSDGTGAKEGG